MGNIEVIVYILVILTFTLFLSHITQEKLLEHKRVHDTRNLTCINCGIPRVNMTDQNVIENI